MIGQKSRSVGLRVEGVENDNSGRSVCYVDQNVVEKLQLLTGTIIEIEGNKRTTGIVIPSIPDKGRNIIRLSNLQQLNAGARVGDFIRIKKATVFLADEIELTPTSAESGLLKQREAIKKKMINKPIVRGDVIEILDVVYQESDLEDPVNHIMKLFPKAPRKRNLIGSMRMVVEKTLPSNKIVKVTQDTKVRVNSCIAILNNRGKIVSYEDPVSNIENDIEYRKVIEDLLSYTGRLEGRIRNIETEKHLLNLEQQKLDYGKRILNNAIERLTNITSRLLDSPMLSDAINGNFGNKEEEGRINDFHNLEKLDRNLTRLESLVSNKTPKENNKSTGFCRYCGGEFEEHQIYCRHCGTKV